MTMSTIAIGVSGMQSAMGRIEASASRVARSGAGQAAEVAPSLSQLGTELVGQRFDAHLYTANLRVVQTADRMLGSLLDRSA